MKRRQKTAVPILPYRYIPSQKRHRSFDSSFQAVESPSRQRAPPVQWSCPPRTGTGTSPEPSAGRRAEEQKNVYPLVFVHARSSCGARVWE